MIQVHLELRQQVLIDATIFRRSDGKLLHRVDVRQLLNDPVLVSQPQDMVDRRRHIDTKVMRYRRIELLSILLQPLDVWLLFLHD